MKEQVIVGVYRLGYELVELVLRAGTGGEFYFIPEDNHIPRIKIGGDYKEWVSVADILFHESFEFAMARHGLRYEGSEDLSNDHSAFLFIMTHPQFSNCCTKVCTFVSASLPDLNKAWMKWKKQKKS